MSNIILPNEDNGNKIIKPGDLLFPTIDINQIQQEPNITEKDMGNAGFKDPRAVNDLKYIIKDILSGDPKAAKRPEYTSLGYEQIKIAIKWLEQQGLDDATLQLLLEKPYLLTFKDKPPTPDEFLTSKYIGSQAESVWWPVRKNFLQFFDPLKPYRTAVLNPSIGSGKQQPISSKVYISKNKYKFLKDIQIGDSIYTPFGDYAKVISIQKNGIDKVYKITLSDGRSFRTGYNHFSTVCFRKENNKKVFDTLTTHYIKENLNKYNFEIPSELELLSMRSEDTISLVAEHENEPSDNIIPLKREQNKVYIEDIEYIGEEEQWCITLNDPLGLYYTDDKCITHNSTFTMLALLYIACHFALMRDPWKFFGKSRTTVFIIALCAVTQGKAKEIYNEPLRQLIESASFWHWCRTHQEMLNEEKHLQESDIIEYIPWTTAVDAAQPLDAKVYLPDGTFKKMGDLQIGDKIASPTSGTTIVEGFPFEGETDIYEIELDDGRKTRCSLHHKWIVAWEKDVNGNWIWKEVTTEFMLSHEDLEFEIYEGPKTKIIKEKSLDNCD